MTQALAAKQADDLIEQVIVKGDLAKLQPIERVNYYTQLCQSLGLNPLSKPFEYITLNGKLTLYARKDATDQLRKIYGVSIEDVDIKETDSQFIVKAKGRDKTGRSDVDLGVVNKSDMRGDTANALMKAITKAKRRLTLSLCGLGLLDETEVETIPDAKPFVEPKPAIPSNPLNDELLELLRGLNEAKDSILWNKTSLAEYAAEILDDQIPNAFDLDDERKQILVDDLRDRLAERKAIAAEDEVYEGEVENA